MYDDFQNLNLQVNLNYTTHFWKRQLSELYIAGYELSGNELIYLARRKIYGVNQYKLIRLNLETMVEGKH